MNIYEIFVRRCDNNFAPFLPFGIMIVNRDNKEDAYELAKRQVGVWLPNNYFYTFHVYEEGLITSNINIHSRSKPGVLYFAEFSDILNGRDFTLNYTCELGYDDCPICYDRAKLFDRIGWPCDY